MGGCGARETSELGRDAAETSLVPVYMMRRGGDAGTLSFLTRGFGCGCARAILFCNHIDRKIMLQTSSRHSKTSASLVGFPLDLHRHPRRAATMTLARVGRRTAESILRGARRSPPAAPGTSRFRPRKHLSIGFIPRNRVSVPALKSEMARPRPRPRPRRRRDARAAVVVQKLAPRPSRRFRNSPAPPWRADSRARARGRRDRRRRRRRWPRAARRFRRARRRAAPFFETPRVGPGRRGADAGDDSNVLTEKETTDRRYEDERESEGADGDDDAASSSDAAAETSADPPLAGRRLLLPARRGAPAGAAACRRRDGGGVRPEAHLAAGTCPGCTI